VISCFRFSALVLASGALAVVGGCAPPPVAATPAASCTSDLPAPGLSVSWRTRDGNTARSVVEVTGVSSLAVREFEKPEMTPDRWKSFLAIRVIPEGTAETDKTPPLLGTYRVEGDVLRFEPRFPLEPGVRYRAELDLVRLYDVAHAIAGHSKDFAVESSSATKLTADLSLPRRPAQSTASVTAVYPTRATLPENLLRFYIHFSAPMSRAEAYQRIRLLDAAGKPVDAPFLELDEELWSGDGKRFTLLFDPGRVKRGLRPREEAGPVLEAGKSYTLVIDRNWPDADGNPLKDEFRKPFRAGPLDGISPDPRNWSVHPPEAGTRAPLEIRFPEPLDRALLDRLIAVRDGADKPIQGAIAVSDEETVWRFTPLEPWRPEDYRLLIGTDLEDAAGNSIARPFEIDETGPITRRIASETVALPFRIRPAPR
jgi:hypothetical protein